jgi:hypothetical protein
VRYVAVHFYFQVSPQIKVTNKSSGDLGGHNLVIIILSTNTSPSILGAFCEISAVALSC